MKADAELRLLQQAMKAGASASNALSAGSSALASACPAATAATCRLASCFWKAILCGRSRCWFLRPG